MRQLSTTQLLLRTEKRVHELQGMLREVDKEIERVSDQLSHEIDNQLHHDVLAYDRFDYLVDRLQQKVKQKRNLENLLQRNHILYKQQREQLIGEQVSSEKVIFT